MKKSILIGFVFILMLVAVACSNSENTKKELQGSDEVIEFGNRIARMMNAREYDDICEYWSQAYVELGEAKYKKSSIELIKDYRVNCTNLKVEDASVESIDIYEISENEKIYSIVISVYGYKNNTRSYMEEIIYVFKEDGEFVFSNAAIPLKDVIELSKSKYGFSSPVSEDE